MIAMIAAGFLFWCSPPTARAPYGYLVIDRPEWHIVYPITRCAGEA